MTLDCNKIRGIKGRPNLKVIKKIQCQLTAPTREHINITTQSQPQPQSTAPAIGIGPKGLFLQGPKTSDIWLMRDIPCQQCNSNSLNIWSIVILRPKMRMMRCSVQIRSNLKFRKSNSNNLFSAAFNKWRLDPNITVKAAQVQP